MKNHIGNTALHEAVKAPFPEAVISCLFLANPKVSYYLNEKGESPLRLAIETGKKEILELLFTVPGVYDGLVGRPQEESPVYAAILMERLGTTYWPLTLSILFPFYLNQFLSFYSLFIIYIYIYIYIYSILFELRYFRRNIQEVSKTIPHTRQKGEDATAFCSIQRLH